MVQSFCSKKGESPAGLKWFETLGGITLCSKLQIMSFLSPFWREFQELQLFSWLLLKIQSSRDPKLWYKFLQKNDENPAGLKWFDTLGGITLCSKLQIMSFLSPFWREFQELQLFSWLLLKIRLSRGPKLQYKKSAIKSAKIHKHYPDGPTSNSV